MEKAIIPPEKKPYQEIGDDLRAQIAQGRYPVGSRLPPERHIAETYGVSRTIVREALLMLELQGTVDIRQGSGVYVMRIPHENDSEEEQLLSSDVGPFEILQARQLLESNIAAFAAKMATRADIDNLKRIIEQEQRLSPSTTPPRITPACSIWCWPGRRRTRCCCDGGADLAADGQQPAVAAVQCAYCQPRLAAEVARRPADAARRAAASRCDGRLAGDVAASGKRQNSLLELSDEDAPDFDGYLFDSVPIFQGKLV
mgnify:CR=1 FL=1